MWPVWQPVRHYRLELVDVAPFFHCQPAQLGDEVVLLYAGYLEKLKTQCSVTINMNAGSGILRAGLFGTIFALVLPLFSPAVCVGFIDEPKLTYFGHNEFRVPGLEGELITVTNDKISFVDKHGYVNIFDIGDGHVINSFEVSIEANRWAWRSIVHDKNLQRFAIAEWRRIEIFNTLTPTDPLVKIELPPGDQEWPIKPSPLLTFSVDGEEIAVFDLQTSTFSVFETNSGNLRYSLPVKDIWQIVPSIGGEYWLMSDQSISIIAQGKCKRIHRTDNSESFKSVRMSGSTVFTVTYKSGNNFVVERDAETFDARNRWLCNSWFIAVIGGRPIFSLDCKLFRGEENGEKTALCSCDDKIVRLQESPSNKHLVGQIEGGVLVWDTASWMPNTHNSSPRQNDLTFAVNDQGRLSILSGYNLLKSSNEGIDFDATSLPNSMSREPGEFSLSTNGGGLVYLDDSNHVFHLSVNVENAAPTLVKLPESCLPTGVSIGEDGQTILIRYDLKIVRNDPDARNKTLEKNRQELRRKLFDEPPTANSVLTEGCHVFKPGDANPLATGVICTEADLSDKSNLFIHTKTKMIGWIGEDHVGIWKFSEPQTKATIEVDPNYRTTGLDRKKRFDRSNYTRFEPYFSGSQYVTEATQFQSVF